MVSHALRPSGFRCRPAVALGRWRHGLQERRGRSRGRSGSQPVTGCFGVLTGKDEMVVRGLAVSLASSTSGGQLRL